MESESIRSIYSRNHSRHLMRVTIQLCLIQFIAMIVLAIIIFVLLLVTISLIPNSTGKNPDFHSLEIEIGDKLGNSSLLVPIRSQTSSTVTFYSNEEPYTILLSNDIPSTITDYLPLQQLPLLSERSKSVYRGDFNYLESNEPIYLLSGSSIMYNITIILTRSISIVYPACLYLFTNETCYNDFLMLIQNNVTYNDSHCFFIPEVTQERTTKTVSHSFNIKNPGVYYVGIQLQSGVTVQANASVVQVYYNTTGLQKQTNCSSVLICSVDVCKTSCSHETTTYFLVKPVNKTSIHYNSTSLQVTNELSSSSVIVVITLTIIMILVTLVCFCMCHNRKRLSNCIHNISSKLKSMRVNLTCLQCLRNRASTSQRLSSSVQFIDLLSTENQPSDDESTTSTSSMHALIEPIAQRNACQLPIVEVQAGLVQTVLLESCENDVPTLPVPQIDMESVMEPMYWKTSDQMFNSYIVNDRLLIKMKNAFGELQKLSLDRSGLVYHCSQYGVTLIIPEGAVQESATVWFGVCLFSDKFKFGDYVPVTPIVWVHIDQKLDKSAELYIPHHIAISSEVNLQQFTVLTARDDDCSDVITFQESYGIQVQVSPGLFKILSSHFCSNCVAIQKRKYKSIPRRYLIARADKKNGRELLVQFIFLCQQKGCKKVVEEQCAKEGFKISFYEPVTFTGDGQVSLSFEPHSVPGWKREEVGFSKDYISIQDIDYYQMMGCENAAEVTEDELERLEMLEDLLSYPPRFRIQFTSDAVVERSEKVIVRFNQVYPPVKNTILLEGSLELPLSPASSASSTRSGIDLMTYASDLLFGDCLSIITSERGLRERWFDFGYRLGLTLGQLQDIELTSTNSVQPIRKVIIQWRDQNRSESWEPLAAALVKIGFEDLAHRVKDHFESPSTPEPEPEDKEDHYKGVYCKLCNKYHLNFEDIQHKIPKADSPPDMVDLINLVAVKIQDKFYEFGTALHLDDGFLRSLYVDYHDSLVRFIVILNRWKDNGPDAYTWSTVIKVLQSDAIGASKVAQNVMKHLTTNTEAAEYASS
ncbi:PREDICTED: uncharacterized protein LOC109583131 [Amphimedon queenslandica]|uniref:Death domain-containing protein n=1 Tax=Amphimedon queenslandica TaxID=400682 RepID=A0A1X7UJG1_AMPQE|nr:PREDICTED: uncharacterized protein LOC109583131 [Amphimedon queenslandica]|eukprot:XP_019853891.1 PREDICTED: uncharacterized protein LOC109583131 [Amphimedon queenslandica]